MRTDEWAGSPLSVESARGSYLEAELPADAYALDCALLTAGVAHEWQRVESLCASA